MKKKSELNELQSPPQRQPQKFFVGDKVLVLRHGGEVEGSVVDVAGDDTQQTEFVYSVRLETGEVRHFTADQLKLA